MGTPFSRMVSPSDQRFHGASRLKPLRHRVFALKYVQDVVRKMEVQFEACSQYAGDNDLGIGHENAPKLLVGRPGLDPGTLGLKGRRVHHSLFIRFREPHIHRVLRSVRSVRSVAIGKC
jgi:hypothetical protein